MSKKNSSGVLSDENLEKAAGGYYKDAKLEEIFGDKYFDKKASNDEQDEQLRNVKKLADSVPQLQNALDKMKKENGYANKKDTDFYNKIMNI